MTSETKLLKSTIGKTPERTASIDILPGGAAVAAAVAVKAEHDTGGEGWSEYLDKVREVLDPLDKRPAAVDMRVANPYEEEIPRVLVSSENGQTNISHLLQEGGRIIRHRPKDGDGDKEYLIRKAPYQTSTRGSDGREESRWKIALREVDNPTAITNIGLEELVADVNPDNGRSWRLQIPASLPPDFAPANGE